jgi:hypothetical protein
MLERNGFGIEKMVGKGISMPLRILVELLARKEWPDELFNKIFQFELALCEKPDALSLTKHLQAVTFKSQKGQQPRNSFQSGSCFQQFGNEETITLMDMWIQSLASIQPS